MNATDLKDIPGRKWATRGDELLPVEANISGHHRSPDAIGGYYGISWYEVFKDQKTGEIYKVYCYDGVYRSKGVYEDET